MLAGKEPHVAEGGSDKHLHSLCHVAAAENILQTMTLPPPPFTDFFTLLGFSYSSVWRQTRCFLSDPNKLNLLSSLKWTLAQFSSVHTTCSSAKVSLTFWFFLLMRGLQCVLSVWLPCPVQCSPGEKFQLQCWTDSPLRVSALCCPLMHLYYVDDQPFGGIWMN